MTSKHLVDPELLALIEQVPGFQLSRDTLPATRAMMQTMQAPVALPPTVALVTERRISGSGRRAGRTRAGHTTEGCLVAAGPASCTSTAAVTSWARSDMTTCKPTPPTRHSAAPSWSLVYYRLAPETPHPGPVEDCYAGLAWLHANAEELGVDRTRIAVTGESAGGGLAAATVLLARDRAQYPVAFQHLVFPMLDDRTVTQTRSVAAPR